MKTKTVVSSFGWFFLLFVALGWTGDAYGPIAISVGAIVCIAAANGGGTSQDLKTGFLVGATPLYQQLGLIIGAVTSLIVALRAHSTAKAAISTASAVPKEGNPASD